ncbi:MAG: hypothetical protein EA386_00415 [Rhodobacteraceae bacterium]|nr:MAG: hypothetical protein EA386_00415 [Paracoccaceae bacterium]
MSDISEFATRGERGLDVFRRVEEQAQRRYRYSCIATVNPDTGAVTAHAPVAQKHPDRMRAAADRLAGSALLAHRFSLGSPQEYPAADMSGDPLHLFVYLDFCRLWQLAEQEFARAVTALDTGAALTSPEISNVLRLALDFNRIARAEPIIERVLPDLMQATRTKTDDKWQNAAYSLRMIGDLRLRADRPQDALAAYEAALALGKNPHRMGLAIQAAHAAQDWDAAKRHLRAFEARWPLPDTLAPIKASLPPAPEGGPA